MEIRSMFPPKSPFRALFGAFYPHPAHQSALRAEGLRTSWHPVNVGAPPSPWPLFSRLPPHTAVGRHQRGQVMSRPFPAGYCLMPTPELGKSQRSPIAMIGRVRRRRHRHPRRVAGEHYCSPAPSERHVNLSVYAAQASRKVPCGTRWGTSAPPARYWSGADERNMPETAPAGKLLSSALSPKPVVQTVSCGDTRGKSARFRVE